MSRTDYYEEMKALARDIRSKNGLDTPQVRSSDLRRIYKGYGIKVDLWPNKYNFCKSRFRDLNGAFFNDELGPTIMINRNLPEDPKIFTMGHELKHFLVDSNLPTLWCGGFNENERIEIGANVFAAELIFPEQDFINHLSQMGIGEGECTPIVLVQLKRETKTTLSYAGLVKRAERLAFAPTGSFASVKWKKLEEEFYGVPFYKRSRSNS
ncbi:ImmA/IrrE family metallo-endopeptidase [Kamptonema animale CS-326]|jgi:Zn-dependent peptidase ImmA (M78 family)|uniref:ImmA/IrrE family metallo-endopeptidase n=1 Tax=Kamptonema animale TaxID=92934 RepID=UPI00232CC83D|nr:ImmA/IrrE family metallo-endopeptidase [Kamptonema animale]MDB9515015.1 ImmA/IrrE family metallo-endopeptidase [Kamptonema animale CS-326]